MAIMTSAPGHFLIPTSPAPGTAVVQSGTANTYGTPTQLIASTAAALYITGIYVEVIEGTNLPTYVGVQLYITASTVVDSLNVPFGPTTGVAASQWGVYKPIFPYVPVANATKILAATASSIASGISYLITLECIAQTNVVDDGLAVATVTNLTNAPTAGDLTAAMKTSINASTIATVTNLTNAPTVGDLTAAMKTSINASTIATVTNLTNAPTVGDFTATMKTSLQSNTGAGKTTFNE